MCRTILFSLVAVVGAVAVSPAARADESITELVVGLAIPQADDGYEAVVDDSFLLGFRLGSGVFRQRDFGVALELSAVWQLLNVEDFPLVDEGFSNRVRASGGVRAFLDFDRVRLFGRFGIGIDYVNIAAEETILGTDIGEDSLGFLLEPGAGILLDVGNASVGLQFAVPMAMHDADEDEVIDLDYESRDLDILLTLGGSL